MATALAVLVPRFAMIARDITRDCELLRVFALAFFCLAWVTSARADAISTEAHATSDEACPADALVRQRVARELADPTALRNLDVQIALDRVQSGYRLTVDTERESVHGTRVFEAATCGEVVDAAALLIVLMLDDAGEASPAPVEPVLADTSPPPRPLTPPPRRARATLRAAGLGELGYLPRVGVGFELGAGVAFRAARLELSGLWLPAVHSDRAADGARVRIGLWAARLGYCQRLIGERLALLGCVGAELGRASGSGVGLAVQRDRAYVWAAGHVSLRASWTLGRGVALLLEPALAVPIARRRFVSTPADGGANEALHTPAPVSGRLAIALESAF